MVLPLIESRVPVTSVRRIVVQHSKSIEETAALFTRYMKILVENPRYSRILLGLPGLILIVLGALSFIPGGLDHAIPALGVIAGAFLVIRGFKLDKAAQNFVKWIKEYSPPPFTVQIAGFSALAGILVILVGGYLGGTTVADATVGIEPFEEIPQLIGHFLNGATYLIGIGISVILSGRAVRWFFERDIRLWRTIIIVVAVVWSSVIFVEASKILINPQKDLFTLTIALLGAIPVVVSTFFTVLWLRRKYSAFSKGAEDPLETFEES